MACAPRVLESKSTEPAALMFSLLAGLGEYRSIFSYSFIHASSSIYPERKKKGKESRYGDVEKRESGKRRPKI